MGGVRVAAVVVMWVTVGGGLLLAVVWFARGGIRAVGPEDEIVAASGVPVDHPEDRPTTSFSSAQVGIHGLLGILTAATLSYAVSRHSDRDTGYVAALVAIAITSIPGALMFAKWRSGERPAIASNDRTDRVEDRMPKLVVFGHGLAAVGTVVLIVVLLVA